MTGTGPQPKQDDWKDWPAMSGGEEARTRQAESDAILRDALDAHPNPLHSGVSAEKEEAIRGMLDDHLEGRLVLDDPMSTGRLKQVWLDQHQILALLKAQADALAQKLHQHGSAALAMPLQRSEVLDKLAELRRLASMLPDGALPRQEAHRCAS